MDYRAWINHVRAFSESLRKIPGKIDCTIEIDPPLAHAEIAALEAKWPTGLPNSLKDLWTTGSRRMHCLYIWKPSQSDHSRLQEILGEVTPYTLYGGVRFEPAHEIFPGNSGADPNDQAIFETLGRHDLALWCRCAIFLRVGDGDCLGLDPERNPTDPAVVYLMHDQPGSRYISQSFTEFVRDWTELSFIGPEVWLLDYWIIDRETGRMDTTKHKTDDLRRLLNPRSESHRA